MCSGPSFLVSVCHSSYLTLAFFLPEKKTTFHISYCRWCWNDLSSSGFCPTSSSFSEPVTQHTSCPAALLFLLLLLLPSPFSCSSSSQLYLSDLWPHKNLILTSGPPLLLSSYFPPCSSLVQSSGDPLLLFKSTAQCVYYCLCTCMLHALLLQYWSVSLCNHKSDLFVSD